MKYGEQLEHESVPKWSLHNLDYNSLKHEIKAHTTRDQAAKAIAIPGQTDLSLHEFEDALFLELCQQHDRLHLFVTSKASEISIRLESLSSSITRWAATCPEEPNTTTLIRRHRKSAKFERELQRISDDINALSRFANAQVVAIRKILKKYKKWTGSTTLTSRFNNDVLSQSQSFTRCDFTTPRSRHDQVLTALQAATPLLSEPDSPFSYEQPSTMDLQSPQRSQRSHFELPPPSRMDGLPTKYWNEYDDGSDTAGPEDDYAIYVYSDAAISFPGFKFLKKAFAPAIGKFNQLVGNNKSPERHSLLHSPDSSLTYSSTAVNSDSEDGNEEEGYASSDGLPVSGYAALYAFPDVGEQKRLRYRENVLFWGMLGSFFLSFVVLGICAILISAGRHKLRVEVDAGVTLGVLVSLLCACAALSMSLYRSDRVALLYSLMVWSTFLTSCTLNGMLLVLVVGNTP